MKRKSYFPNAIDLARTGLAKLAAATVLIFAATLPAQASVVTFNDYSGFVLDSDYIFEAGYAIGAFSNADGVRPGSDLVGLVDDGTSCFGNLKCALSTTPYFLAFNDAYLDLTTEAPGGGFHLRGFDASFLGDSKAPGIAGLLRAQGYRSDGSSVTETYQLAGPVNEAYTLAHFNASASFANETFVEVALFGFACNSSGSCTAFTSDQGQFGIDNIDLSEVPEPTILFLFAIGLLGMSLAARNRRSV